MSKKRILVFLFFISIFIQVFALDVFIRINQLGYTPKSSKKAILLSESKLEINSFSIHDILTNEKLAELNTVKNLGEFEQFKSVYQLDFSPFSTVGAFYIKANNSLSPTVYIDKFIYDGTADFLLNFFRVQRCGFNPVVHDYCHQHDGVIVPQPVVPSVTKSTQTSGKKYKQPEETPAPQIKMADVTGGWHCGSDYAKYAGTTAVTVFQLLHAYRLNPGAFGDKFDANGLPYPNKIPDVLDEAKWGIDWLLKMNPTPEVLYTQVGDDRASIFRNSPFEDATDYGFDSLNARPVYLAQPKPTGLFNYQNNSTGLASLAGKFSAVFALGAETFGSINKTFADTLEKRAFLLYELGKKYSGVNQTVPAKINAFQKEDNWVDDMELAATQLYQLSFDPKFRTEAASYGRMEPINPWLFADTVSLNQWYPLINYGHYVLINAENPALKDEFLQNIRFGLQRASLRMKSNPFGVAVPMVYQSNNYITALAAQCNLYRRFTGDSTYVEMETALLDWIFGCNPWGVSMVVNMPFTGKMVTQPYSNILFAKNIQVSGGLVAGAAKPSVPNTSIVQNKQSKYQTKWAVYNDDINDKLTNEPILDGTSSLLYLLASAQTTTEPVIDNNVYKNGCLVQTDPASKQVSIVFSGKEYSDGLSKIMKILKKNNIQTVFFLSGKFLRKTKNKSFIKQLLKDGNSIGVHSDMFNSYFDADKKLKISKSEFMFDLKSNYAVLEKFGVNKSAATYFMSPDEMYNDSIVAWSREVGVKLVASTPNTFTNKDISTPEMRENYYSTDEILKRVREKESKESLNGNILLVHLGASTARNDKFYNKLNTLILELKQKKYLFVKLDSVTGYSINTELKSAKKTK